MVPTPIGNLDDITLRALRVLREVRVILAEDTRHTRTLLRRHGIQTPMRPYHQHNKLRALEGVLVALAQGDVALVSDAGTPAVSDPGFELIAVAVERGVPVDVLPGPSAAITAVVGAAMPAPGFLVLGFLPRKVNARRERLAGVRALPYSLVVYEAPHRLLALLDDVAAVLGPRQVVVARELTKVHQEYVRGTVLEVRDRFEREPPRGECTVVIAGSMETDDDGVERALEEVRERAWRGELRQTVFADVSGRYRVRRADLYTAWEDARKPEERPAGSDGP